VEAGQAGAVSGAGERRSGGRGPDLGPGPVRDRAGQRGRGRDQHRRGGDRRARQRPEPGVLRGSRRGAALLGRGRHGPGSPVVAGARRRWQPGGGAHLGGVQDGRPPHRRVRRRQAARRFPRHPGHGPGGGGRRRRGGADDQRAGPGAGRGPFAARRRRGRGGGRRADPGRRAVTGQRVRLVVGWVRPDRDRIRGTDVVRRSLAHRAGLGRSRCRSRVRGPVSAPGVRDDLVDPAGSAGGRGGGPGGVRAGVAARRRLRPAPGHRGRVAADHRPQRRGQHAAVPPHLPGGPGGAAGPARRTALAGRGRPDGAGVRAHAGGADGAARRAAAGAGAGGVLRLHRPRGERTRPDPGRHRQDPDPDRPDEAPLPVGGTR